MASDKPPKARAAPAASGKEIMRRRSADNAYRHQDFHGALNQALIYLEENFGESAVRDYLRQFARNFYAPLTAELRARGLAALKAHLDNIYALEGAAFGIACGPDELVLTVAACPAVGCIRKLGLPLSAHFDRIYSLEGADFRTECTPDELILTVAACPAVGHIRKMGLTISDHFIETERVVNAAICEGTPFEYALLEYDPESGRSVQRFSRRRP